MKINFLIKKALPALVVIQLLTGCETTKTAVVTACAIPFVLLCWNPNHMTNNDETKNDQERENSTIINDGKSPSETNKHQ